MKIIRIKPVSVKELKDMSDIAFGSLVKAVVDIEKDILAIDSELHSDLEQTLISSGSKQDNLWGINLHPDQYDSDNFIEYDSMINVRPRSNNYSRGVEDPKIQEKIKALVSKLVTQE